MKLYTRSGDDGTTGLHGGGRVSKSHPRVEAYGGCDELNAGLGLALAAAASASQPHTLITVCLNTLQSMLFEIGGALATASDKANEAARARVSTVTATDIAQLEDWIDQADAQLEPLRTFILPGGSELAARLHLARTICRRVERLVVGLSQAPDHGEDVSRETVAWINRAGDLLFVLARLANHEAGVTETAWTARTDAESGD